MSIRDQAVLVSFLLLFVTSGFVSDAAAQKQIDETFLKQARPTLTQDALAPRAKSTSSPINGTDPVGALGQKAYSNSELNVRPDAAPLPAGDINDDGFQDWVYVYNQTLADERTATPTDFTGKTYLRFGGSGSLEASYFDAIEYRALIPVGDFIGDAGADAVEVVEDQIFVYAGTSDGYEDTSTLTLQPGRVAFGTTSIAAYADLDGDGFDDILFPSRVGEVFSVAYGAAASEDVELRFYDPALINSSSTVVAYATGDSDGDGTAEVVRVEGQTADEISVTVLELTRGDATVRQSVAAQHNVMSTVC